MSDQKVKPVGKAWKWALSGAGVGGLVMALTMASILLAMQVDRTWGIFAQYHPLLLPATQIFTLVFQHDVRGLSGPLETLFPIFLVVVNGAIYAAAGYGLWWARPRGARAYVLVAGALVALTLGSLGGAAFLGYGRLEQVDGIWVVFEGEDFREKNWERIRVGQSSGTDVVALIGEPRCRLQQGGREFLVYRTLVQATSWDLLFSITTKTYYYTPENIYVVALRDGIVEKLHKKENRHLIPAEDVEFRCEVPEPMRPAPGAAAG